MAEIVARGKRGEERRRPLARRKIDSNQEQRDRSDKRPSRMRERQVGLRTTTSSRPLLLLNISAMGRGDRGWLLEGTTEGTNHPRTSIIYYVTLGAGTRLSPLLCTREAD